MAKVPLKFFNKHESDFNYVTKLGKNTNHNLTLIINSNNIGITPILIIMITLI